MYSGLDEDVNFASSFAFFISDFVVFFGVVLFFANTEVQHMDAVTNIIRKFILNLKLKSYWHFTFEIFCQTRISQIIRL